MRGRRVVGGWVVAVLFAAVAVLPAVAHEGPVGSGEPVDAKLQSLDGGKLKLSDRRGAPLLLKLWATWCLPCREQAAVLHELSGELEQRGIAVLAVDMGEAKGLVEKFLADEPSDHPVALDRGQVLARLFEIPELPALVLLDAEGRVVGVRRGLARRDDVLALLGPATSSDG